MTLNPITDDLPQCTHLREMREILALLRYSRVRFSLFTYPCVHFSCTVLEIVGGRDRGVVTETEGGSGPAVENETGESTERGAGRERGVETEAWTLGTVVGVDTTLQRGGICVILETDTTERNDDSVIYTYRVSVM